MTPIDRRRFLQTSTAALAATASSLGRSAMAQDEKSQDEKPKEKSNLRPAFMLGVMEGPILPHFQKIKAAGFEGVELLSPSKLDRDEVLKARDETGLLIHGVSGSRHWVDTLSHTDQEVVDRGLEAIRQEMADCKAYGGTTVLVVPGVVTPEVSYEQVWERSQKNIKALIPDAEKHGVKLAIEEVWNRFLLSPLEFARYIDEFDSPWVGAYFDVGNVVEFGYPQEWIRVLGKRILKIHIKEYAKAKRFDYLLGEGEINWDEVRAALGEIGYEGWVTAEVSYGNVAQLRDVIERMNRLLDLGIATT